MEEKSILPKILIGCNYFFKGDTHRQDIAKQSLLKLKNNFNSVSLAAIQFDDEANLDIGEFKVIPALKNSSQTHVTKSHKKKLPIVSEIFDQLYYEAYNCDYFIFTNSDVIISDRLINYINRKFHEGNPIETMSLSRMDIENIINLEDQIVPVRWEIAGFDTFVVKCSWYTHNKHRFNPYLLGKPYFDWAYTGIMMAHSNCILGNLNPPFCFHIHHGIGSVTEESPEKDYNKHLFYSTVDELYSKPVEFYINNILKKRTPFGSFLNTLEDEKKICETFFSQFRLSGVK